MRRRIVLIALLATALLLAGCGAGKPHAWVSHVARSHGLTACVSIDCGPYSVTLDWAGVNIASKTGYHVFLNSTQVADVSATTTSYTFVGIDCGVTSTLGVEAHDGASGVSTRYSASYTTPACATSCPATQANSPGGPDPWGGCFPGAGNTGVPAGTTLTAVPASETVDPGTCTNGSGANCWSWNGTDGNLYVRSCGVTINAIKLSGNLVVLGIGNAPVSNNTFSASTPCISLTNSEIDGVVEINSNDGQGTNSGKDGPLVMTDDTVVAPNASTSSPVLSGNFYATRINISGGWIGFACQSTCSMTDSYSHAGFLACAGDHATQCNGTAGSGGSGYHYDVLGSNGFWWNGSAANPPTTNGVTAEHDTWDCGFSNAGSNITTYAHTAVEYGAGCTADIGVNTDFGPDNNLTLDKNLIMSDPTAYDPTNDSTGAVHTPLSLIPDCVELSNPNTGKLYPYASNVHFTNNVIQKGSSPQAPFGTCGSISSTITGAISDWTYGDGNTFTGNTWDDGTALTEGAGPTNTALPVISGTVGNGNTLTVSQGTWTGATSFTYRWFDCLTGQTVNCEQINSSAGVTTASYTMNAADTPTYAAGDKIKAIVRACGSTGCTYADAAAVS